MGNKVPESHNQLDNNTLHKVNGSNKGAVDENELNLVVNSIVMGLIDSVIIRDSIMSKESKETLPLSETNSPSSNYTSSPEPDINDTYDDMDISYATVDSTIAENSLQMGLMEIYVPTDPLMPDFGKLHEEEDTLLNVNHKNELFNESEYSPRTSPVSGSNYSKLSQVSPTPVTTSASDWKYLSDGYSTSDKDFKIDDNLLESWNKKEPIDRNKPKSVLSRSSLYRQFDPLIGNEDNKYSKMVRTPPPKLNENSDLTKEFEWLRIDETPKSANYNANYMNSPKPDVLAFAIEETKDDMKDHNHKYNDKTREKDILIDELKDKLKASEEKRNTTEEKVTKLLNLIETYHYINEELVLSTSQVLQEKDAEIDQLRSKCNTLSSDRCQAIEEVNGIEKSFSDLHLRYDKMRNDFTLSKENENLYQQQYESAVIRIKELENLCRSLQSKVGAENKQSGNEKKEIENELIAVKVQNKKAEMKINSLQNHLDQKTQENAELSSMLDELILKVRK